MPKTSLKHKHVTSSIDSNTENNIEINITGLDNSNDNDALIENIKPTFPSILTVNDLIKNAIVSNKPKPLPNAFIAYRMALMKEYRIKNCKLPSMGKISKVAKNYWNMEPKHIKDFYETLVKDAKLIYKQSNIQIVLDKHMDNVVMNQENNVNREVEIEKGHVKIQHVNNDANFPSVSSTDISSETSLVNSFANFRNSYNMSSTLYDDREYIRVLEQTIDHLLGN
ncbi:hypothetical protein RclHR1_11740002 [Rhizophagus clarus]|uniref:HMG box domain-containing protein n=1 Tax=Rhizophagus clarus TaxID=94130 RepID=A0A2Z6Q4W5_9GLOM|nr:hypothetical protein RclHR1_11740002 [Rhizophagus clarus]GES90964.1 hypothetical protein GLOIN_2v1797904 [Rhizophagus clarus]